MFCSTEMGDENHLVGIASCKKSNLHTIVKVSFIYLLFLNIEMMKISQNTIFRSEFKPKGQSLCLKQYSRRFLATVQKIIKIICQCHYVFANIYLNMKTFDI